MSATQRLLGESISAIPVNSDPANPFTPQRQAAVLGQEWKCTIAFFYVSSSFK